MPVKFADVSYVYNKKSPMAFEALKHINIEIKEGSFTAIVGRTGCGKSTLVSHINALLNPSEGEVIIDEFVNSADKKKRTKKLKDLRKKVGLVFQFPEYQLFEETVEKDVSFGPKNFGMKEEDALKAAHEALLEVGLNEGFFKRSPFELSGGEKRRVSIAGILACKPNYLVVDEPTAGLDPLGSKDMMDLFEKVHQAGTTIILVTHDMNLVLNYCDSVIVMDNGEVAKITDPISLFGEDIEKYSLETPLLYKLVKDLNAKGKDIDVAKVKDISTLLDQLHISKEAEQ